MQSDAGPTNLQCTEQVQQGDCQELLASFQHNELTVHRAGATWHVTYSSANPLAQ